MTKFLISYTLDGKTHRKKIEGDRDNIIKSFNDYLLEYLSVLPCDISLYEYMLIQDFNPNVPMYGYCEIIRGESNV